MIHKALRFLVDELNDYIVRKTEQVGPFVELVHLKDSDAVEAPTYHEKLGCTLVNIEEERVGKSNSPYSPGVGGMLAKMNPPIRLNLTLLFTANPTEEYEDALKLISHTITFFQGKNNFTTENSPALDPSLQLLQMELMTIPLEQQNYLWGSLGTSYLPSVVYKMRLIIISDAEIIGTSGVIEEIQIDYPAN